MELYLNYLFLFQRVIDSAEWSTESLVVKTRYRVFIDSE